ncbi:hypothetical protein T11_16067 [Trichinella zimbabwensis]|uniref:Uncharacterized protein n=1 Tax=Trichinella zimbabwensis TaxID=268475 RepID=A0A0V1HZC6_9BILA|nr:hypothetical protein T11_6480 [Trichinella zimbabwensis]KRZ19412.1 hypothetical protein T11_16067 [Trichinella zimbabwensis]
MHNCQFLQSSNCSIETRNESWAKTYKPRQPAEILLDKSGKRNLVLKCCKNCPEWPISKLKLFHDH